MRPSIDVVEVCPRDGLQNENRTLAVDTRVELINRLIGSGSRRIEVVSFVRPDRVPQMAGAEEVLAQLPEVEGVSYIGLVLNRRGAERAVASARCHELNVVVPVTDAFSLRNQRCTVLQMIDNARDVVDVARAAGLGVTATLAVAFGCPFDGAFDQRRVLEIFDRVADLGLDEIAFADTIGSGVPDQVGLLAQLAAHDSRVERARFHFHNTRNTGYANAHTAASLAVGRDIALDASVGGFGGCPFAPAATGNIATEDLYYLLRGNDAFVPDLNMSHMIATAEWLGELLGKQPSALLGSAGDFPAGDVA